MKLVYIPPKGKKPVTIPPMMSIAPVAAMVPMITRVNAPNIIDPSLTGMAWPILATYTAFMAGYALYIDHDRRKQEDLKKQVEAAKKYEEYKKVINGPSKVESIDTTGLFN